MAITKAKKVSLLSSATAALRDALSIVFVSFKGLTVAEVTELRAALKQEGVKYTVLKKTLLKRVLDAKGFTGDMPDLPGEVAFAYLPAEALAKEGQVDITAPARGLQTFVKKFKEKLGFLGGVLENKYLTREEIVSVATIPATPVLRGMFVNIINSPIQRLVLGLHAIAEKKGA